MHLLDNDSYEPVTIYDIATEAGVSISTVSRVINGKGLVSLKTRNRIQKVIEKFNYTPSQTARILVKKKSRTVGIVIPEIKNSFYSYLINDIDNILSKHGYTILLYTSGFSTERELRAINDLIGRNADGLILLVSGLNQKIVSKQIGSRIHIVTFHSNLTGVDTINVTNRQAFFEEAEHLISNGHQDIACIVGNTATESIHQHERLKGYFEALKKHGIPRREEFLYYGSKGNTASTIQVVKRMLGLTKRPTAIMAFNDFTAIDVYQAVSEVGLKVGGDVAVTGFDNIPIASLLNPALTTVDSSTPLIAEMITDFLLKRMLYNDCSAPREVIIPVKLIVRESSGSIRISNSTH
ncbi:MAG: LacI family transcriptional regulator [Treponema sp.]|jgi:DNA-binding LacI/PurR family transcriptional regulator|nr:LacI family transcriptional regulator [Treponema sp.]